MPKEPVYVKNLPVLYGVAKTGKLKIYRIRVAYRTEDGPAKLLVEHGQLGGQTQIDEKLISRGKNLGKRNATTPLEQALAEAKSVWRLAIDRHYTPNLEEAKLSAAKQQAVATVLTPMLAQSFDKYKHKMKFPCVVQPKLNGVRCMVERRGDRFVFHTRQGKEYRPLGQIVGELQKFMPDGAILDGELYNHTLDFQDIVSAVKATNQQSGMIQYHVYDYVLAGIPYESRLRQLEDLFGQVKLAGNVVMVESRLVDNEEEAMKYHKRFVQQGYEGLILRNLTGLYEMNYRSENLQKYKEFIDEEFEIIEITCADTGREQGAAIAVCKTPDGRKFNARLKGSLEYRRKVYEDRSTYVGKQLTVRYQNLSKDKMPIFPVGIAVRDYE